MSASVTIRGIGGHDRWNRHTYWKSPYAALEKVGIHAMVVNARHAKGVPGRKTDIADARWLATLARAGLLRGSFVPPAQMRQLRLVLLCHIMSCVRGAMWLSLTHCFIKVFYDDLAKFPLPPWKRPFSGSQITSTLILSHFRNFCHLAPAASVAHSTAISVDYSRHLVGACYA